MKTCTVCGDRFLGEEVSEWRSDHEQFSLHPFICPDCYDRLQRKDLEDQFEQLMEESDRIMQDPEFRRQLQEELQDRPEGTK